jgi:hypothetical protein
MKRSIGTGFVLAALLRGDQFCADPAGQAGADSAPASDTLPMVPPAKPGVFTRRRRGNGYHLVVVGHKFSTRDDVENISPIAPRN